MMKFTQVCGLSLNVLNQFIKVHWHNSISSPQKCLRTTVYPGSYPALSGVHVNPSWWCVQMEASRSEGHYTPKMCVCRQWCCPRWCFLSERTSWTFDIWMVNILSHTVYKGCARTVRQQTGLCFPKLLWTQVDCRKHRHQQSVRGTLAYDAFGKHSLGWLVRQTSEFKSTTQKILKGVQFSVSMHLFVRNWFWYCTFSLVFQYQVTNLADAEWKMFFIPLPGSPSPLGQDPWLGLPLQCHQQILPVCISCLSKHFKIKELSTKSSSCPGCMLSILKYPGASSTLFL